jgi:CDGSH-type Zn-finger protein
LAIVGFITISEDLLRAEWQQEGYMAQVKITVRKNGPYRVEAPEGSIELVDADGNPYDLTGKPAFSLCRCGGSVNKPFCDGTHSRIGFQAAEAAVKQSDQAVSEQPKAGA